MPPTTVTSSTTADAEPEKKIIVLKRAVTTITAPTDTPAAAETTTVAGEEPSPKVAKLTELTALERLELRSKKFGAAAASLPVNTELKKQARAERFGIKTTETATTEPATATVSPAAKPAANNRKIDISTLEAVSVEVLKKRAERFGAVSSKLASVEAAERLAKRQDRFGITAPTTVAAAPAASTPATTTTTDSAAPNGSSTTAKDYAERAKLRLERFKTEVK